MTDPDAPEGPFDAGTDTSWKVGRRRIHGWEFNDALDPSAPLAVVLPGLGLPSYAVPTLAALAAYGVRSVLLDLPGFGTSGRDPHRTTRVRPTIEGIGAAAADWITARARRGPLVIVGHSTGSQAALIAALRVQRVRRERTALVLAGPTFPPGLRHPPALMMATPLAYRADSPGELRVLPEVLRGHLGVLSILWSGMRDHPDRRLARLRIPLTVTAGEDDAFAPRDWLETLAASAAAAPTTGLVVLPGSHNNLYTHPDEVAAIVRDAVTAIDGPDQSVRSRASTEGSDTPSESPASGSS